MGSVDLPEMVQAGIDTVSFYLCLEGSPAIEKIARLPGKAVAYQGTCSGSMRRGAHGLTRSATERSGDPNENGCTCSRSSPLRTSCAPDW